MRSEKNVGGVVTRYYVLGNKVVLEDNGSDKIYYTYDSHDDLVSMNLISVSNPSINDEYYYIRNVQGDIIGLFDKTGTQVVGYIEQTMIDTISNMLGREMKGQLTSYLMYI